MVPERALHGVQSTNRFIKNRDVAQCHHRIGVWYHAAGIMVRSDPLDHTTTWYGNVVATANRNLKTGEMLHGEAMIGLAHNLVQCEGT